MAKDRNPKPEANNVKPQPDLNGAQSTTTDPGDQTPQQDPAKAAEALKGAIKETTLQVSPIAETVDGKDAGAAQSNRGLHMSPAGALLDSAVDDRSRIRDPRTPDRPNTIYDKNSFSSKIPYMNIGSEQAKAVIVHAPTLSEDKMQGTFSKAIPYQEYSNKRRGEAPQSQLHFRSIDFEHVAGEYVYAVGQLVDYQERNRAAATGTYRRIHDDQDYPRHRDELQNNAVAEVDCALYGTRGNYILQGINIAFERDANGREYFAGITFDEDRVPVVRSANSGKRINYNLEVETNIETQRARKLTDSDLVKPESDKVNEFAMALGTKRKTFFNLFGDMEADTGFIAMMSYRFANIEYASVNSRLAKSGSQESNEDLVKYFITNEVDLRSGLHTPNLDGLRIYNDVFNSHVNDNTLPMIPWYRWTNPSIRQFSDWSTLLTNNHTPKTLIDKAEKVLESFFVKPEAWNYVKNSQLYSTVDGYNPNTPIIITPDYKIIVRENFNLWSESFNRNNVTDVNLSGTAPVFSEAWCQRDRKNVQVNLKHPFVDGLLYFFTKQEDKLLAAFGGVDGIRTANGEAIEQGASRGVIHYNCDFTTESFNPFCFIILAALPYMAQIRNNNTYRIPQMWGEIGNPAADKCVTASAGLALSSANFTIKDYSHAIMAQQMSDIGRFRYFYPERFTIIDSANVENNVGNNRTIMRRFVELPWYIAEDTVDITAHDNGLFDNDDQNYAMNYPILRKGLTHSDVQFFTKFSPKDMRLILDAIVEVPRMHWNGIGSFTGVDPQDFDPVSMDVIRHDEYSSGRVVLGYETVNLNAHTVSSTDRHDVTITVANVLQTPRELGFFAAYKPFEQTIIDGTTGITLEYDAENRANRIQWVETIAAPIETAIERLFAIQDAMALAPFREDPHDPNSRYGVIYDMPCGAGIYGESFDLYWNQYNPNDEEGMQIAAGYLQIYDRVYNLYTQVTRNQTVLHDHDLCFGLAYNFAPYGNQLHNAVHDVYLKNAFNHSQNIDYYYDDTPAHGFLPYLELTTSTATRCVNNMLTTLFKPYNFDAGIEVAYAINYGAASTDPTVVIHSPQSHYMLDLFEMAYYFNFVGFDATYYIQHVNERSVNYNSLEDGYLKDDFISQSLLLQ